MIELRRAGLDPRVAERWRIALAQTPLVARLPYRLDGETLLVALPLSLLPYLLAFGLWYPPQWSVDVLQGLSAAWTCLLVRQVLVRFRPPHWTSGRFLHAWGYAEVDRDVLRLVPIDALAMEVRGAMLGRVRVTLRAEGFARTLWLASHELGGLERALEIRGDTELARSTLGYRDVPARIEGPRAPWRPSRLARELAWSLSAAAMAIVLARVVWLAVPDETPVVLASAVTIPVVGYENADGLQPSFAFALVGRHDVDRVDIDLDGCASDRVVTDTVESYLRLALRTPHLGPARPGMLSRPRSATAPTRIHALCSWQVDHERGRFASVEARTQLEHRGEVLVDHLVRLDAEVVRTAMTHCGLTSARSTSPHGLAIATSRLVRRIVAQDVLVDPSAALVEDEHGTVAMDCLAAYVRRFSVVAAL